MDASIVVVEPTLSGIHDLKRALDLLKHFEINPYVMINKYDINMEHTSDIDEFCTEEEIVNLGHVPFDPEVTRSMVAGKRIVVYKPESPAAMAIVNVWNKLRTQLEL